MDKTLISVHHRPQWRTHIGFLLATIGSAVGLGNIWRFPYLCYQNGGGAFLIPYLIALLLIGIPLMILEIGLGHKVRGSAPASFASINKHWEWLGWWQVIFVMFGIVLYYSVIISWCLNYLVFSFNLSWGANPGDFFFKQFLHKSARPFPLGNIRTQVLFALGAVWFLNWIIVFRGVEKGLEKANKIFMPLLFLLTLIITIWSLFLPGAKQGILVYVRPDFFKLKDITVWIAAFSQIFFTLSLGFGIIIAYASYLPRKSAIVKDAIAVSFANSLFSIIAGFGVFAVLGYMSYTTGRPINQVVDKAIGLSFVVYPKAISMLPALSQVFGVIFFGILFIAGLSSSISIIEAFTSGIVDKFGYSRRSVVSYLCVTGFLGSLIFATEAGLVLLDIVDHFLTQYGLVIGAILECILLGWVYKPKMLRGHINSASHLHLPRWWDFLIKVVAPGVLIVLLSRALIQEFSSPYQNYPAVALILVGRDWLVYTLFAAFIVASRPWQRKLSI